MLQLAEHRLELCGWEVTRRVGRLGKEITEYRWYFLHDRAQAEPGGLKVTIKTVVVAGGASQHTINGRQPRVPKTDGIRMTLVEPMPK